MGRRLGSSYRSRISRCTRDASSRSSAYSANRFKRRYPLTRHGLKPFTERVTVVRHELGPVPRADLHIERLLCCQMGMLPYAAA